MFYYAEINSEYKVINKHCLSEASTNPNYIPITEDLYNNGNTEGDIVNQYYNTLLNTIEVVDPNWEMGQTYWMTHRDTKMRLSTKIDNMDKTISLKADINHTHTGYASSDDLTTLEDIIETKANASHTHNNYATITHNHDANYADINHNHDANYATISHTHNDYVTTTDFDNLETTVEGKANTNHSHSNYATVVDLNSLSETVSDKANASHNHDNRYYTETEIDTKLADKSDSDHTHTGVYDINGAAASALSSAKSYTDTAIDTLSETVATKANASTLTSHAGNTTVHVTQIDKDNWNAAKTHADSAHAPSNAEPNQNAFSNVVVGDVTISADTKTDTLTLVAGNNVTITPDSTGDSITISSANTVYTHPTSAGNKHIPAGGSSGQILRWASDGTAVWGNDNNTTYSVATETSNGLMSADDKTKLDGIAYGANNYTLPSAGTSLGGVKSGGDVSITGGIITVNDDSHNHVISNIDGLQSALNGKAASNHNHDGIYYTETEIDTLLDNKANTSHTHTIGNITNLQSTLNGKANASHGTHVSYSTTVPVMDGSASVGTASTVARSDHKHPTDTSRASQTSLDELSEIVSGKANTNHTHTIANVTNLQTTLDSKASNSHTHNYAGSSSVGGAATSANKLNTNAGSATQPVYFANGVPVKTTYTLNASVPSGAKFTDTTYGVATASVNGLMNKSDKSKLDGMVLATVSEVETYLAI